MISTGIKVIVAGGGPVGLTAALALSKANIDFLVLEKNPNAIIDAGSDLVLSHISTRALYQCGLEDSLKRVTSELGDINRVDHKGRNLGKVNIFHYIAQK